MSSVQTQITDLPTAQPLTGSESVPIVQNGVTVKTTTGAMAGAGALNYPFLTVGSTSGLSQARYLTVSSGLSLVDNGAGSTLQINMTGAAASLNLSSNGIQVKTGSNTLTGRSIGVNSGLSISNANGVSGDPTISLGTFLSNFVSLTGTGVLAIQSGSVGKINILGTSSQTTILNGDGSGNITVSLADNAVMPGAGSITLPNGTTAQRVTNLGSVRYNTSLQQFEGYSSTGWNQFSLTGGVTSFSAGTTGFTPNTDATGAVTLGGILNAASGGTGASTLTGYVYGNGTGVMTASTTIPNAGLANSSITINGSLVSLGGSITVTATASNALTISTGLTGTSYNGSAAVTIAIDSTVATLTGVQTLTNKTISGSSNTLSNIGNASLTNSSITINGNSVSLGGSITVTASTTSTLTIGTGLSGTSFNGSTPVTIAIDSTVATLTGTQTLTNKTISGASNTLSNIGNSSLTNSSVTYNGVNVALGSTGTITAVNPNALTIGTGLSGTSYTGAAAVTIAIDSTVATLTGVQTLTNKTMSGASNTFSAIPNSALSNSTISGVALGSNLNALTIGTGLTGTSYNGSGAVTVAIDSTVATLTGTQTLTNKSISGSTNTLTNIPNSALTNSSLTIGSTAISLGGTSATLAGLTSVTVTQDPVSALQLATKQYVDSIASGLNYHQPVNYASTAALPSYIYNNGASGVGATITAIANGALSFGGGSPTAGQRLLVKDESGGNAAYNGIYDVTSAGGALTPFILTRSSDYDTSGTGNNEIDAGDYVLVISGTNASTAWVQQTQLPIVVGTTPLVFLQFNAPLTYFAGTGLNLSPATTFNISNTTVTAAAYGSASSVANFTVNAQGQLTAAASTAIAINGNQITSGTVGSSYISGSYTGITGVGTLTAGTWNAATIGVGYGDTGLASYTIGDMVYASGTTTLSKLAIGTSGYVLTAGASAPTYVAQSTLSVGTATNATNTTNTGITAATTGATNYLTFVTATTGNLPQLVNSSITANAVNGTITGGIAGGAF